MTADSTSNLTSDATVIVTSGTASDATIAPSNSRRSGRPVVFALALAGVVAFSGCSAIADKATEEGVERMIESSLDDELGDVDIDFDGLMGDGGGDFSIRTDDGSFSLGEDGSIVIDTPDGTFTGQADDDGISLEGDDGSRFDMGFDTEFDTESDTEFDTEFDDAGDGSGSISFETADGEFSSQFGDEAWSIWPSDVPRPDFDRDPWVSGTETDGVIWILAGGTSDAAPATALASYTERFSGYEVTTESWDGSEIATLTNDTYTVIASANHDDYLGATALSVSLSSL
jgi:hypothetical protein